MNRQAADARKGLTRRKFLAGAEALGTPAFYELRENLISFLEDCDLCDLCDHQP